MPTAGGYSGSCRHIRGGGDDELGSGDRENTPVQYSLHAEKKAEIMASRNMSALRLDMGVAGRSEGRKNITFRFKNLWLSFKRGFKEAGECHDS